MKIKCDCCPACNRRVRLVRIFGGRHFLCEQCAQIARRLEEVGPGTVQRPTGIMAGKQ